MCHRVRTYDSMLKKIVLLVLAFAAFPIVAYATPVSWDFTSNILQPLLSGATALVKADHFQATSTTPSLFPYASTTAISGTALCLGTDCRTTWPSGSVSSVFGRTGVITAQSGDYNTSQVTESGNLYFTNARAQGAVSATYPVLDSSGIFSLAFGTTTTNNWSNLQTFNGGATLANNVTLSGVTGSTQCLHVNTLGQVSGTGVDCGSSSGGVTSIATTYPITGGTITTTGTIGFNGLSTSTPWTNGFLPYITSGNTLMGVATSSLSASGPIGLTGTAGALVGGTSLTITCSTCNTSNATVSSVGLSSSNSTLTIGSTPVTTSGTLTADLNLSHANIWSALQSFSNSSTSFASQTNTSWFGATATTTINADGLGSIKISGTGNITDTPLATAAGTFVAADATGKLIATTTPTGSNFFTNSSIYTYLSTGTNIGVGTSTPSSILTIDDEQTSSLKIYAWGGGGGGGSSGGANFSGGGGGAGAYVVTTISSPAPSYVVDVASGGGGGSSTVSGAGGTGYATGGIGAPSHYSGGGGGSSAFGTAVIACGGGGGGSGPYGSGSGTTGGNGATGTSGGAGGYNSQAGLGGGGGAGATNGSAGANSAAGAGGTGCTTTSGTNGNGSDSPNSGTNFGGGGSSAGASGNGISATTATGAAGSGGAAGGSSSGGNGTAGTVLNSGGGGGGNPTSAGNGGAGAQPGAGGGGAGALAGAGASGEVIAVFTSSSGAISTTTYSTVGTFTFTTPSSPAAFSVWLSGKNTMSIDQYGHLITGGSSPTCGTGCTSIQGDDKTMRILTGSSVLSVTVNFANVWTESPICIPTDMSGVNTGVEASTTVSSVTLTLATALTTKYIGVICQQSNNFSF